MAKNITIGVVVLLAALSLVFWYWQDKKNNDTDQNTQQSISVFNQTRNADGSSVSAAPSDVLVYTLTVMNTSDEVEPAYVVETNIDDLSELATLTDAAGANYNASTNSLMWTPLDIPASSSIEKTFTVRVKDSLPQDSDMILSASFGNEVLVTVSKPVVVDVSTPPASAPATGTVSPAYSAPITGPSFWFAALLAVVFTAGILLYRFAKGINV